KIQLERAAKLFGDKKGDPSNLAWIRFLLARALWDTDSDRGRAVVLAQEARAAWLKIGNAKSGNVREVEAWLSPRLKAPSDWSGMESDPGWRGARVSVGFLGSDRSRARRVAPFSI